jgi:two-component system OmpR family response regulator
VRVLVIEDEVGLPEMIRRGLVVEGFVVDVEHRGDTGFGTAASGHFDAIVLDNLAALGDGAGGACHDGDGNLL